METRDTASLIGLRFKAVASWCLLLFCCVQGVVAQTSEITVYSSPIPVFSEKTSTGKATGYSVELARAIAAQAGYQTQFVQLPFEQSQARLHSQTFQMTTGLVRIPAREQDYHWVTPINANPIRLYIRDESALVSADMSLQSFKTIGALKEDYRHQLLRERYEGTIVPFDSWTLALEALIRGDIEAVLFSEAGVNATCARSNLDCQLLREGPVIEVFYSYIALPKLPGNKALADRLSEAAIAYKRSVDFLSLHAKWLPSLSDYSPNVTVAEGIVGFGFELENVIVDDIWVITSPEPLFSQLNSRSEPEGYSVELVQHILESAGIKKPVLAAPWERIMRESERKSNVIAFALTRTPERESSLHWITPITRGIHGLFGDDRFVGIDSLDAIKPQTKIAVLAHDYRKDVAEEYGLTYQSYNSWPEAMGAVLTGEADLLFGSDGAVNYACKKLEQKCDNILRVFDYKSTTTYLTLSKSGTRIPLVERLKAAAYETKNAPFFKTWSQDWETFFEAQPIGPVHIEDGVVNFWQRPQE